MNLSTRMKKIVRLLLAGIFITIVLCCGCFLRQLGSTFRIQDIRCKNYLETSHFANELQNMILLLDSGAYQVDTQTRSIRPANLWITRLRWTNNSTWAIHSNNNVSWKKMLDVPEYWYFSDEYGISALHTEENEAIVYNNSWYEAALSDNRIENASEYYAVSHDDYVDLIIQNAQQDSVTGKNSSVSVVGELESEYIEDDSTFATNKNIDVTLFSDDSYIGSTEDFMYVYSPQEDMFYTSIYGWYSVPETLFFLKSDFDMEDLTSPLELLRYQFTSQSEILRMAVGNEYLDLIREQKNLDFSKRNMVYYVAADNEIYTNAMNLDRLMNCNAYLCIQPTVSGEYTIKTYNFENANLTDEYATRLMQQLQILKPDEAFYVGFYTTYPYDDSFSQGNWLFRHYFPFLFPALILAVGMMILFVMTEIQIIRTSGKCTEQEGIHLYFLDKLPVEGMVLAVIFGVYFGLLVMIGALQRSGHDFSWRLLLECGSIFFLMYELLHVGLLSLIRRGRAKVLWKYSAFRVTLRMCKRLVFFISGQRNLTIRTVELFILYWLLQGGSLILILLGISSGEIYFGLAGVLLLGILNIGVLILLISQVRGEQSIREGLQAFVEGNLEYRIPKRKYLRTEQEIINNMEHLSDGLHKAVEKSIYDERMKAELITNVSHDIKTPLTSIINYVDLIKQEKIENEKVIHYIEVLDRKSWRLKQLMEDLVEVSKITSGNIELERMPIDFGELLRQSIGEFEDKFAEQELKIVETIQDKSCMIFADGRRTFRVLENLFQNIYKYAMPKTRVYIDLQNENDMVFLSIKNISKAPLNIDANVLMERFIRGEQSRTTEGSGLGLSIAQDLVKLQDGEFQIYLDGDLFKVMITFPEFISKEVIDSEAVTLEAEKKEEVPKLEKE